MFIALSARILKLLGLIRGNYNLNLSSEDMDKITALMNKINGLNLNFSDIKDQLNKVSSQLKGVLTSPQAQGFKRSVLLCGTALFHQHTKISITKTTRKADIETLNRLPPL